ncbi:hypothetical protein EDB81DRAFT_889733 [Dactylonectria macrodidyma]|uniref:Uncharacterized protein n=1 Tax=Dactylonectria macrodidyma TaxID=307937 RepID=A0A9P9DVJ2_9HYPO|nr:hypothetical protein EDB81DRAFT_889733 [Dactylonectria macrodidyma]
MPINSPVNFSVPWLGQFIRSMEAMALASKIYNQMPGALVDMKVTTQPLHRARWVDMHDGEEEDIRHYFACISYFDTGRLNIRPQHFINAMAISSADSIYVAESLLNDPSTPHTSRKIRHVIGNVGKPGLSVLGGVSEPMIEEPKLDTW